jgi:hypothetical protein
VKGRATMIDDKKLPVYKGMELSAEFLEAVLDTKKRLLWAFITDSNGDVQACPYTEHECIWLLDEDVVMPNEVEL